MNGRWRSDRVGWNVVRVLGLGAAVAWSASAVFAQDPPPQGDTGGVGTESQDGQVDEPVSTDQRQSAEDRSSSNQAGSRQAVLVQWVLADQRVMVELARWGRQRAEHPEVQRLVDTIVEDHGQLIASLERASDGGGDGLRERAAERRADRRPRAERRNDPDRRPAAERREERERRRGDRRDDRRDDPSSLLEQRRDGDDRRSDTTQDDAPRDAQRPQSEDDGVLEQLAERADRAIGRALNVIDRVEEAVDPPPRLIDLSDRRSDLSDRRSDAEMAEWHRQIAEETKQVAIRQLEETRRGAAFDAALVGMLTAAHIREQASLNVLSQQATGELQNVLQQAADDVQHHLRQCEQVMQQIERAKGRSRR